MYIISFPILGIESLFALNSCLPVVIFSNEIEFHSAVAQLLKPGHATALYMLRDKAFSGTWH